MATNEKSLNILHQNKAFLEINDEQIELLVKAFQERLAQNHGEFLFQFGSSGTDINNDNLSNEELQTASENLLKVVALVPAQALPFSITENKPSNRYIIRRQLNSDDFIEVRLAVLGNVDAGKSTLLGVLTRGQLDDGRGLARQHIFRFKHEQETGRTSSVANDILGFDENGDIINSKCIQGSRLNWTKVCQQSQKLISFLDLAGHERYLKTTIFGLTGLQPHCAMLMVGANAGLIGMGREHLGLCLALSIPLFVVITKLDITPTHLLRNTLQSLQRLFRSASCRRSPLLVRDKNDVWTAVTAISQKRPLCPIFQISSVTGDNLEMLKLFLNLLAPLGPFSGTEIINSNTSTLIDSSQLSSSSTIKTEFQVEEAFTVPGVGCVVSGLLLNGRINCNDTLMLGPNRVGKFIPVVIKSIHRKRLPVNSVEGGSSAALALKKIKKGDLRRGMVLISDPEPVAYWELIAEILVLHHPTTISKNYQAMVHCGNIRQTATIFSMSKDCLRTGDKAKVHLRFVIWPEYIRVGQRIIFREGRTKAIGSVIKVIQGHAPQFKFGQKRFMKPSLANQPIAQLIDKNESDELNEEQIPIENLRITSKQKMRTKKSKN